MNKSFSMLMLWVVCLSCNSDAGLILKSTPSDAILTIKSEVTYIPIDSLGLVVYRSQPAVYKDENSFLLYAYNRPLHSLDIISMSSKRLTDRIQLADEGPNEINRVYSLYVKSTDSLYIMGGGKLYLLNEQGQVLNNYNTMFEANELTTGGFFHAPNEAQFKMDDRGTAMFGYFSHYDNDASNRNRESLEIFILGRYDLMDATMALLPVAYSDFIKENEGDFEEIKPNFSFIENKLYYGFPIESNIYVYDFETDLISSHGAQSSFSENRAKRSSKHQSYNYRNEGTWFNRLNKYPMQPYFYRTHWGSQDQQKPNGDPSDASSKPGYIMFFDDELAVIDEIKIDQNCYLEGSFATDEGVFFWAKDGEDETQIKLCRYYID